MVAKTVKIKITETFVKQVEVRVPHTLESDARIKRWVREHIDDRILDATSQVGVEDVGDDMDYSQTLEVVHGGDAS